MAWDLRRLVRRGVRKTGFRRQIAPTIVDVMKCNDIDVVIDVGANDGDFGREIRDEGYVGRIVSFEPNPTAFARLAVAIADDPLWEAYQLGVGDEEGELRLSVASNDVLSSFKGVTDLGARSLVEDRTEQVRVVRLDSFLLTKPDLLSRTYLKIDTQGFEMEVLRGAGESLQRFVAVQAELGVVKTYQDEEDWLNVLMWMRERGFEVGTMICNSAFPEVAQVREFDLVFVQRSPTGLPRPRGLEYAGGGPLKQPAL